MEPVLVSNPKEVVTLPTVCPILIEPSAISTLVLDAS
jgi:hypothetical protein